MLRNMTILHSNLLCRLRNGKSFSHIFWASCAAIEGLDKIAWFFSCLKHTWVASDPYIHAAHLHLLCRCQGHRRTKPLHTILVFWRWFELYLCLSFRTVSLMNIRCPLCPMAPILLEAGFWQLRVKLYSVILLLFFFVQLYYHAANWYIGAFTYVW
jgi:hypothetical protein